MDSSGDSSFVTFKHFRDLEISTTELLDKKKIENERRKRCLNPKIKLNLQDIDGCHDLVGKNVQETTVSTLKTDLESKLQVRNELKIMLEILESELRETTGTTSQKEIDDLMQEVLRLENEKKQRIEKLVHHRDTIIKCLAYYKRFLDSHLTFSQPDAYTFYFDRMREDGLLSEKWIKLRSDDAMYWMFIDGSLSLKEKEEVTRLLKETENIQAVLCKVRKMLK